mgnify:CR=1 FL=1
MKDLTLAWTGRLPVPPNNPTPPRPAVLAAELFHTWNTAFFEPRGVEIVLYRGRQRRSGRLFGRVDLSPSDESDSDETSESSSSSDSESDDPYPPNAQGKEPFPDLAAARRRYYEQKMQRRERRRERQRRRRERRKNKNYAMYAICTREGAPGVKGILKTPSPMIGGGGGSGHSVKLPPVVPGMVPQPGQPIPMQGAVLSTYPGMLQMPPPGQMPPPPVATSSSSKKKKKDRQSAHY